LPVTDTDGDGTPDFQDVDSDNDGISDLVEGGTNPANDTNNDGMIDSAVNPNGIPAVVDPATGGTFATTPDTDGDGVDDYRDLDSDNDGLNDVVEAGGTDSDGNALIDIPNTLVDSTTIPDENHDGILDPYDPHNPNLPIDIDGDGDDVVDDNTDTDGDGFPDVVDASPDSCEDGPVTIEAIFWIDENGNGERDAGEEPIAGARVELLDAEGNPVECPLANISNLSDENNSALSNYCITETNENGIYYFTNLPPKTYQVRFTLPEDKQEDGYDFTTNGVKAGDTISVEVSTIQGNTILVRAAAAVSCGCANITSDSIDALEIFSLLLMMLLTLLGGLAFIRKEWQMQ
jgi:hypothetical protein